METKTAAFAAGCFWGVEEAFRRISGVEDTAAGYMGGHVPDPTYEEVCAGTTGHAETVQVKYDPARISYESLLAAFWRMHDPTQTNRQGPDVGEQYRSVIFTYDDAQERAAAESAEAEARRLGQPIATRIAPATEFYRAEEYHQQYAAKHGGSCHI